MSEEHERQRDELLVFLVVNSVITTLLLIGVGILVAIK